MKYLKVTPIKLNSDIWYLLDSYPESGIYLVTDTKKSNKGVKHAKLNDTLIGVDKGTGALNFISDMGFLKSIINDVNIWKETLPPAPEWTPPGILDITSAPEREEQVSSKTMLDLVSIILHNNKAK